MIPFLTDLPSLNSPMPATALLPQTAAPAGGIGADFAGLLDAALPLPAPLPEESAETIAAVPLAALPPGGTILPPTGKALPGAAQAMSSGDPAAELPDALSQPPFAPPVAMFSRAEDAAPALVEALPTADQPGAFALTFAGTPSETQTGDPVSQAPVPATASLFVTAQEAGLTPPPAPLMSAPLMSSLRRDISAMPPRPALPGMVKDASPSGIAAFPEGLPAPSDEPILPTASLATPAPAPAAVETIAAAAASLSEPASSASGPATAPQIASGTPATERGEARIASAPQLENAIAQVGELREALKAARPEMTLRHDEFGFVSLRLETVGADGWRAMLASRDPGFVPAIQTALAERALAVSASASADPSGTQTGSGQHGSGDQRYGSSPNGGQATSQPYSGQSGPRDGEAASDHRRSSTAAALAERVEEQEADASPALRRGGMFA
ncbi:hypothetical protein CHX26_03875 [Porphyrobacter sp. HT-58-2]|uniref:hypothetical protein n=1 Tax=Porphyrobacter sp. HT-58-2 TaxID=2023229 RepID=UPI000CDCD521|nr:hypothetical protein [Porphyrobacter sp. HT-58-2]AUX68762.1 hypothetical protein CHX26_03875 [Porphyrobacter sp. HT-58-2]